MIDLYEAALYGALILNPTQGIITTQQCLDNQNNQTLMLQLEDYRRDVLSDIEERETFRELEEAFE
jgi:hypothetical protein